MSSRQEQLLYLSASTKPMLQVRAIRYLIESAWPTAFSICERLPRKQSSESSRQCAGLSGTIWRIISSLRFTHQNYKVAQPRVELMFLSSIILDDLPFLLKARNLPSRCVFLQTW